MKRGCFVVIDGPDASGKTTQTALLARRLRKLGRKVSTVDFPRYGKKSAALVENYLAGQYGPPEKLGPFIPSLFFALDRFDARQQILKTIARGEVLISNRYVTANMAHQGGKIKNLALRRKFYKWVRKLEYDILGLPTPDLHIFLSMPPLMSLALMQKRGRRKDLHEKSLEHLQAAHKTYEEIAKQNRYQVIYPVISGKLQTPQEINDQIWQVLKSKLKV